MPLLVGSGAGGVTLADSIQAILRAVHGTNTRLASEAPESAGGGERTEDEGSRLSARIVTVQLLELYEDRAIQAAHTLREMARSSEFRNDFVFDEVLGTGNDGERRVTFDEITGWWQRVRIARDEKTDELTFEALTDRARAEASLLPTQRLMVQGLLERASRSTATDLALSATLFELLVPRALKEQAPDRRPLVLLVDDTSATLPWELLHDRWSSEARPLSVDAGMVRQFVTPVFRSRVQRAPADTALVIGDPPLEGSPVFRQLPGAAAEARAVASALRENGFETTELVGDDAAWPGVLSSLFGHPYRILHVAAHGVHEFEPVKGGKRTTGVVLGNGAYLTAAEFEQLRVVPDLVFVNCCHLAAGGEYGREVDVSFWRLAPNVAFELIRMGVRAVVAAGWAVDDQAAKEFARRFYVEMLAGQEFGQAVLRARQAIFSEHGAVNTWGAYQCYGDPGFALKPMRRSDESRPFAAERELCHAVLRLGKRVRTASSEQKADLGHRLDRIVRAAQSPWLRSGVTCAAIARAYAELGRFDEAVDYYQRVLVAEPASATLEDIEQLANLVSRVAARQKKASPRSLAVMKRSTGLLRNLAALGETTERLSLLGGTAKRYAQRASGRARMQALTDMVRAYGDAYGVAVRYERPNAWYPLSNAVAGKVAMSWLPGAPKGLAASIEADMKNLRDYVRRMPGSADFWELALPADVRLLEAAVTGRLSASERKGIEGAYRAAGERAGTPREMASATAQIEFLRDIARSSSRAPIRQLALSLEELRKALAGEGAS
jgi:pentatricopeptide repeat protein